MRIVIFLIVLCFAMPGFTQSNRDSLLLTNAEWVNKDLNYLRFFKDSVVYSIDNSKHELIFDYKKRKLSLKEKYVVGGTDLREEQFDFKIKELSKNKLVLVPLENKESIKKKNHSRLNSDPFLGEKQFVFYNRGQLISRVSFKKITFHATTCFGTCPSMSVEISNNGTVKYQGRIYTKKFTGNYVGKLSKDDFYQFRKIVNRSQLRLLDQKWEQKTKPNDKPRYNYIVELNNGDLIEINTNDQHPILDKLSQYFLNMPEMAKLNRIKKKHKFAVSNLETYKISVR